MLWLNKVQETLDRLVTQQRHSHLLLKRTCARPVAVLRDFSPPPCKHTSSDLKPEPQNLKKAHAHAHAQGSRTANLFSAISCKNADLPDTEARWHPTRRKPAIRASGRSWRRQTPCDMLGASKYLDGSLPPNIGQTKDDSRDLSRQSGMPPSGRPPTPPNPNCPAVATSQLLWGEKTRKPWLGRANVEANLKICNRNSHLRPFFSFDLAEKCAVPK